MVTGGVGHPGIPGKVELEIVDIELVVVTRRETIDAVDTESPMDSEEVAAAPLVALEDVEAVAAVEDLPAVFALGVEDEIVCRGPSSDATATG